ncbi:MAG: DUF4932 domain-containing protein [Planctomycetota bacterium]|nr:DUF4932 domain-containing protein [Planctomycetota bacterium]
MLLAPLLLLASAVAGADLALGQTIVLPRTAAKPHTPEIAISVDPRLELMSVVARLAGHPEYNMPVGRSVYSDAVDEFFGEHRGHAAVRRLQRLRAERGISYDAIASFAVHLDWQGGKLGEEIDFGGDELGRLGVRWTGPEARAFLGDLRGFVRDTGFRDFFDEHRAYHTASVERFEALLGRGFDAAWFEPFFGGAPGAGLLAEEGSKGLAELEARIAAASPELRVHLGLLLGGHNYGVGVDFPGGRQLLSPCIGTWSFDEAGLPVYDDSVLPLVVHEFSHSYTNPLVDAMHADLVAAGGALFPPVAAQMRAQAYGTWRIVLYETLVRAAVLRYRRSHGATARELSGARNADLQEGFKLVPLVEDALGDYEEDRERWPTLADFLPVLVERIDAEAEAERKRAAARPVVVSMTPANGASDVAAGETELRVNFDRAMAPDSYSVMGGGPSFPKVTGAVRWEDGGKTFVLPVRLEAGHTYSFGLNGPKATGFRAKADGAALAPVAVTFTVAD